MLNGFSWGPIQGFMAYMDSSELYDKQFDSTRRTLGPLLTALGAASVWGAPRSTEAAVFYREERRWEDYILDNNISTKREGDLSKAETIEKNMAAAGCTAQEIEDYLTIVKARNDLEGNQEALREIVKDRRFTDETPESIKNVTDPIVKANQKIYEDAVKKLRLY
jgi:hypothetical protein